MFVTCFLLYIQNISPVLIGLKATANSSQPTGVDQISKMRALYHRFDSKTRLIDGIKEA